MAWLALANTVVDKELGVASQHSHGRLPISLEAGRAFAEKFEVDSRPFYGVEASCAETDSEPDPFDEP